MKRIQFYLMLVSLIIVESVSAQGKLKESLEYRIAPHYSQIRFIHSNEELFFPPNYASNIMGLTFIGGKKVQNVFFYSGVTTILKLPRDPYIVTVGPNTVTYTHPDIDFMLDEASSEYKYALEIPLGIEIQLKNEPIMFDLSFILRHWNLDQKSIDPLSARTEVIFNIALKYRLNEKLNFTTHINQGLNDIWSGGNVKRSFGLVDSYIESVSYWTREFGFGLEYRLGVSSGRLSVPEIG